ncbi:MAG: histidinol-phosphate aminotransferase family protein [Oscillospiraceae bacterium]|nr:histidinol-phosphate aminotransferase family protein [Oscillospiraceae bacterium]
MYKLPAKLEKFTPYEPLTGEYAVRLDVNESFLELPTEQVIRAVLDIDKVKLNRYPDPYACQVVNAFADLFGCDPRCVTAGNGSDELIGVITAGLLEKGDKVLTLSPDFTMYSFYAELYELQVHELPKGDDFIVNAGKVVAYIKENDIDCLMFSNPCNPTSLGLEMSGVLHILRSCPDTLIVVDEAYMDFWTNPQGHETESMLPETANHDNLIVLRTCSKSVALAGIRLGFAVANEHITRALRTVKSPFNVNAITQSIGAAILSDKVGYKQAITVLKENTHVLYTALNELAIFEELCDTKTNFVFAKTVHANEIYEHLFKKGIAVRCFPSHLRICAGSSDDMNILIKELKLWKKSKT